METITAYYTPLAFTKIVTAFGFKIACHIGLVYTNSAGLSFGATSGPSYAMSMLTPVAALDALVKSTRNEPSAFGTLMSYPKNNSPFHLRMPDDFFTQNYAGNPYPHALVAEAKDLSAQWKTVVETYAAVGRLNLTYSPITQNSNSMAGNALRRAGLDMPFSSATCFAPGAFTLLPKVEIEREEAKIGNAGMR